ncbi:hypothetical protein [Pilimelia columellifera]|uniref:H(+)-exporting diphosphatase n=1 Tax=Pilimelia columellifera subsp. columellifera TaxID=706583 RepID=A0ABP6ASH6_9ACTN
MATADTGTHADTGAQHALAAAADLSGTTILLVVLALFSAYGLGFAHAILRRARNDYRVTRKSLPGLRRGVVNAFTTTAGRLALVFIVIAVTMAWSAMAGDRPPA